MRFAKAIRVKFKQLPIKGALANALVAVPNWEVKEY